MLQQTSRIGSKVNGLPDIKAKCSNTHKTLVLCKHIYYRKDFFQVSMKCYPFIKTDLIWVLWIHSIPYLLLFPQWLIKQ